MAQAAQARRAAPPPPAVRGAVPAIVLDDDVVGGVGFEGTTIDEQLTPFLRVIENNSKQVKAARVEYVPGAQPGMLLNTATNVFYDGTVGLPFVPVHKEQNYGEWTPIDDGGGFHGIRSPDDAEVVALRRQQGDFKALKTERGTELIQTFQLYVMYAPPDVKITPETDPGALRRAIVAFSSTKIPVYKRWMTTLMGIRYPTGSGRLVEVGLFNHVSHLATIAVSKGTYDWFNYLLRLENGPDPAASFLPGLPGPDGQLRGACPLVEAAYDFYQQIRGGAVKVDYSGLDGGHERQPGEDEGGDIPGSF